MAKTCPSCGAPIDATAEICPFCGTIIPQKEKQVEETDNHETHVYSRQVTFTREKKYDRNKTTAAVLAFFLGALGIDQFYVGNNGWGIAILLFTICSAIWGGVIIAGIIALVHFVQFIIMSDEDFDNKYNY